MKEDLVKTPVKKAIARQNVRFTACRSARDSRVNLTAQADHAKEAVAKLVAVSILV